MIETKTDLADTQIPTLVRMRVEAAMVEMIQRLRDEGISQEAIALALADAAEDYVILLATRAGRAH